MHRVTGNTILILLALAGALLGLWFASDNWAGRVAVTVCLFVAYAALFLLLFIRANADWFKGGTADEKRLKPLILPALLKWSPLPLALLIGVAAHQIGASYLISSLYHYEVIRKQPPPAAGEVTWYWNGRDVQADVEYTNTVVWDEYKRAADQAVQVANIGAATTADEMPGRVRSLANSALPVRIVNPAGCRRIIRFLCSMVNGFYEEWRLERINGLHAWAQGQRTSFQENRAAFTPRLQEQMNKAFTDGRGWSLATIRMLFQIFAFLSLVSLICVLFALLKSYAYVLSRLYLTTTERVIGAGASTGPTAGGAAVPKRDQHLRDLKPLRTPNEKGTYRHYLVSSRVSFSGVHESRWPPHRPLELLLSRMRNGLLLANRCTPTSQTTVTIETARAQSLAVIDLDGSGAQEWIVQMENVVAFSDNVRFSTYLSFKLFTLVFGRILFVGVRAEPGSGPAQVVLSVPGGAEAAARYGVFPQAQLIAFKRNARFRISSSLTTADIFLSRVSIEPTASDACIRALDLRSRKERVLMRALSLLVSPV